MINNSNGETNFTQKLLLTNTQVLLSTNSQIFIKFLQIIYWLISSYQKLSYRK